VKEKADTKRQNAKCRTVEGKGRKRKSENDKSENYVLAIRGNTARNLKTMKTA
jgi:hypothetical protein